MDKKPVFGLIYDVLGVAHGYVVPFRDLFVCKAINKPFL